MAGRAVSVVGDGIGSLALVVHVQATEGTGTAVALLLLAASLPRLLSPLAGTVADRFDARLVLAGGELGQGLLLAGAALWLPPLPVLVVLLLAKATIVTVAEPAAITAVPALVPDDDLPGANALLGGLRQAGEVLGPLLGGLVVAGGGVRAGLAVDALTFLVSVPLLARLPGLPPEPTGETAPRLLADARAGLAYALRNPVARPLTMGFFLVGLGAGDDVALPFLARDLDAGERGIGVLYAAVGAGLVLGYLVLAGRARRPTPVRGLVAGAAVAAVGNALTGLSPVIVAAVAFQLVRGTGLAAYETMLQTVLQRSVPRHLLGRVSANVYGGVNVAACIGLLVAGPLLDATSARVVLVASGAVGVAAATVSARAARVG
ncbi:MAG TPA: MFS transporter [Acidimicrobiales bacterium]|nr:MFS transporter [Acidimicrobiales bacterium]